MFTSDYVGEFANRFNVPRYVVCVPSGPQIIPGKLKFFSVDSCGLSRLNKILKNP